MSKSQELVPGDVVDGVMVVHGSHGDESYEMTRIPPPTAYLVQNAKKDILQDLGLQSVLTDLNRASDLLYLAYLGVVGTGDLHARISNRQKELSDVCGDCVLTMTALKEGCLSVLDRLTEAYSYLLEANEPRALKIISRCADNAHTMATKCEELAVKFGKLKDDTKQDAATATKAWGDQVVKIKELEKLRAEMEATQKQQEKLSEELNASIEELKTDIAKEEAKEETAEKRAFITSIVGAISGAIGAGLGAYASSKSPVKVNLGKDEPAGGKDEASGDDASKKSKQDEKAKAEKAKEEADQEEENAAEEQRTVDKEVFDADADNKAKKEQVENAKAADPKDEEKVKEAQAAFLASSKKLSELQEKKKLTDKKLEKAKKKASDSKAALSAAGAALDSVAADVRKMSQEQADQARTHANNRIEMVKQKREMEKLRRDAVGQLAALTSRLESNTREEGVEKSAQTALEIATWALNNIYVSLNNAKFFWDNMKTFCDKLADPKTREQIKDEVEEVASRQERIKYYKSPRFVSPAINYISRWAALANVCEEYVVASQHARKSVLGHIRASPNAEEARQLIGPLKKQLQEELAEDAAQANLKIGELDDQAKQLELEKLTIKADEAAEEKPKEKSKV